SFVFFLEDVGLSAIVRAVLVVPWLLRLLLSGSTCWWMLKSDSGIVNAVTQGRIAFQRILTYTLRSILHKVRQVPYLGIGLFMTGHAILTPMLVVISMITGD
ncbi:hypothetical protein ABK046_45015, partial [Streptomyces caeruleatus]